MTYCIECLEDYWITTSLGDYWFRETCQFCGHEEEWREQVIHTIPYKKPNK